jgi:hypothetical protein
MSALCQEATSQPLSPATLHSRRRDGSHRAPRRGCRWRSFVDIHVCSPALPCANEAKRQAGCRPHTAPHAAGRRFIAGAKSQ